MGARVYLNGFPKSGLHLAVLMASRITSPWVVTHGMDGELLEEERKLFWCGTFKPAFSTNWRDMDGFKTQVENQPPTTHMKGHVGWTPEIEKIIHESGQAFGFIYRDLRDVAVSIAYHIEDTRTVEDDGQELTHPGKSEYMELPTHEDRLMAVICGLNDWPGLFERWELYAPWLDLDWVFPIRYEHLMANKRWFADQFIRYALIKAMRQGGIEIPYPEEMHREVLEKTVEVMGDTSNSLTFRKGGSGGWEKEFTPEIKTAFKDRAGDWLTRLSYEKGNDW